MTARRAIAVTALAVAVTAVAPALTDGASAATTHSWVGTAASVRAAAQHHHPGLGIGTAVTLHKVHGKVVHVHHHKHHHPRHR